MNTNLNAGIAVTTWLVLMCLVAAVALMIALAPGDGVVPTEQQAPWNVFTSIDL